MLEKIGMLLLLSLSQFGFSQSHPEHTFSGMEKPEASGENLFLETDRQFYCAGEKIYFTAGYRFNYPVDKVQWSKVIYVELIRWNGEKIAQAKCKLYETSASGYLEIPGTLLSGNYYMRAYTKWMRNYPVEEYSYSRVKIINPYESRIDPGPTRDRDSNPVHSIPVKGNSHKGIECFTDKLTYKQREKVDLTIQLKNHDTDYSDFCVSVAKAAYIDTNTCFIHIPGEGSPDEESNSYLPEYRGISISGKILNAGTPLSVSNATVRLSTPQNWKYFTTFRTKENGSFYFTLPDLYGNYDFYIDAVTENGERAEILVDNDFCNRTIRLDYTPFSLDSLEEITALEMTVNMQLSSMYADENTIDTLESNEYPFFGKPRHRYFTEDYIQLPTLEEFIYELVKEVRTTRIKRETKLKLAAYSQYHDQDPLILLDNIPVLYVDELLRIPLEKIEKIEIYDEPYLVTGKMYSGVICVSTKRKDFAGIKLNPNSLFFGYDLLSEGPFSLPDHTSHATNKQPNRQNLLFWDPDIELNQDQSKTLSFYSSDSKGEYIVYIRSINDKSKPQLCGSCKIVVE